MINDNPKVDIIGYSERGIVSSFMYEMVMNENALNLFSGFLEKYEPMREDEKPLKNDVKITDVKVLLEHSFSDFGDADVVLLLKTSAGSNLCIFIEAKVSNGTGKKSLSDHFEKFCKLDEKNREAARKKTKKDYKFSSNLFTQMYHKNRLVKILLDKDCKKLLEKPGEVIEREFPSSSTKTLRKIGSNDVVLKTLHEICCHINKDKDQVWYLALVSEGPCEEIPCKKIPFDKVHDDYKKDKKGEHYWDVEHYGYIVWPTIEEFCKENGLQKTLGVFEHNRLLIFKRPCKIKRI